MPISSQSRSPAEGDAIVIAAQSGRALAAAARRAGLRPFVADLFGDEDTRALAEAYCKVSGRFGRGPGARSVLAALDAFRDQIGAAPLGAVLGSGFEGAPELMRAIAGRFRLLGPDADIVTALKDPAALAGLLDSLGIPHPAIRLAPTADADGWLVKRRGGSGGRHIAPAVPGRLAAGSYLQRKVPGEPRSLNFLSNGTRIEIIAVTAQWTSPAPHAPFRYGGAVEPGAVRPDVLQALTAAVAAIVAGTGLRGLASVDFLVEGTAWWLLEINPRPGATTEILDRRSTPLLMRHIEACLGRLGPPEPAPSGAAASEILYARRALASVPPIAWPEFVMDRPPPGSRVAAGAPICTVRAEAATAAGARELLRVRAGRVRALMRGGGQGDGRPDAMPERQRARVPARRPPDR
jgi:uncharacterized protein